MNQKNISIILLIVGGFCFFISAVVYPIVRYLIIKKHLPRLNKLNPPGCKKIEFNMTLWWPLCGEKIIKRIDKKLSQKLFIMTLIFGYLLSFVGLICVILFILGDSGKL